MSVPFSTDKGPYTVSRIEVSVYEPFLFVGKLEDVLKMVRVPRVTSLRSLGR